MKKLSMKIDELLVESFAVQAEQHGTRGTVRGNLTLSELLLECTTSDSPTDGSIPPSDACYESIGCTFTADYQCMDTALIACP